LSTGAKAGIGIGASVGVLVAVGLLILSLRQRRAARQTGGLSSEPTPGDGVQPSHISSEAALWHTYQQQTFEQGQQPFQQPEYMTQYDWPQELAGTPAQKAHELDTKYATSIKKPLSGRGHTPSSLPGDTSWHSSQRSPMQQKAELDSGKF
jgi:hypothetical protein